MYKKITITVKSLFLMKANSVINKSESLLCAVRLKIKETVQKLNILPIKFVPRCEKTGLWGFRPGPTQTGLYSH